MINLIFYLCFANLDKKAQEEYKQWQSIVQEDKPWTLHEFWTYLQKHPSWPSESIVIKKAELSIRGATSSAMVLKWFNTYPPTTIKGVMAYAEHLSRINQIDKAKDVIAHAWMTCDFDTAQQKSFLKQYGAFLTEAHHLKRANRLLYEEKIDQVRDLLPFIINAAVKARIGLRIKMIQKADAFALSQHPSPGMLFDWIRYNRKLYRDEVAYHYLQKAPPEEEGRFQSAWWKERNIMARRCIEKKEYRKAYHLIASANVDRGTDAYVTREWLKGWLLLSFLNEPQKAYAVFSDLYAEVRMPISRSRAAYWASEALQRLGKNQQAAEWLRKTDSFNYYGMLAHDRLQHKGNDFHTPPTSTKLCHNILTKIALMIDPQKEGLEIAEQFTKAALNSVSTFEEGVALIQAQSCCWRRMCPHLEPYLSIVGVKTLTKKFKRAPRLKMAYPEFHPRDKTSHTTRMFQNIYTACLAHSITRQESEFNPKIISYAGAMGYMQLRPATARFEAKKFNQRVQHINEILKPHNNITWGTSYILSLLERFDQCLVLAIAAYDAGPHRVDEWLQIFGDPRKEKIDIIHWIECIPFEETRNYVMRVTENMDRYLQKAGVKREKFTELLHKGCANFNRNFNKTVV